MSGCDLIVIKNICIVVCKMAGKPFTTSVGNRKHKQKREQEMQMQW